MAPEGAHSPPAPKVTPWAPLHPPAFVMSKLQQFSRGTGLRDFLLIGGAAMDPLLRSGPEIHDWDIVIVGDASEAAPIAHALKQSAFEVGALRDYRLDLDRIAVCFPARHHEIGTFDIAVVGDMEFFGPFDIESLYVTYPAGVIVDEHHALRAVQSGRAALIRAIESEIPAMLAKRLFVLAAKYGIRFGPGSASAEVAQVIRDGLLRDGAAPPSQQDQAACLAKLLGGLARAARPDHLLADALDSRLILGAIPPFQAIARHPAFTAMINADFRPGREDLLRVIRRLDGEGRCAGVLDALEARIWDGFSPP